MSDEEPPSSESDFSSLPRVGDSVVSLVDFRTHGGMLPKKSRGVVTSVSEVGSLAYWVEFPREERVINRYVLARDIGQVFDVERV